MGTRTMTPKESIRAFVERMPDDVTMEQLFYKLQLFVGVEKGIEEIDRGEFVEHDDLFDELMEDAQKASNLVAKGKKQLARHRTSDRARLAKNGSKLRKATKEIRE